MTTTETPATKRRQALAEAAGGPVRALDGLGDQLTFYAEAIAGIPVALTRYRTEILRLLAQVAFGKGALAVVGGTAAIIGVLSIAIGFEVALQGYPILDLIGVDALVGFFSAYVNTREGAPLIAGIGLAATVGAGYTAELGAMRISEEIDALEVIGIRSLNYLVSTRIAAGLLAIIPLYTIGLVTSYVSTELVVKYIFGQPGGTYSHYFGVFLYPTDILYSLVKVMAFAVVVMLLHCYYGFNAVGGPSGVGVAVGRATRASLVSIVFVDLAVGLSLYGAGDTFNISG